MTTRRRFLSTSAAALAAPLAPSLAARPGRENAGRKIRLGHIGVGGQGSALLRNFLSVPGAISVGIADPFRSRREAAGLKVKEIQGHDPQLYSDFRDLLANPGIDAVIIATPDHWHVPIALAAIRAGKDLYVEKPLGHSLAHNKLLLDACLEHDRIFQYGTQQRSQEIIRRGIELVINGRIGEIQRIDIWAPRGSGGGSLEPIPIPEGLDYELYIGPAPMKPCTKDRMTSAASWHCADYALGFIAGWGAHPLDLSIWGQNYDQAGNFTIRGTGTIATPTALFNTISSWDVQMEFAGGIRTHFMSDDIARPLVESYRKNWSADGTTFFGSEGWISLSRNGYSASNPAWFREKLGPESKQLIYQKHYYRAFVDAVRTHSPTVAPIQDALRSDALSHLSVIAIESGSEIVWDPKAYRIVSPGQLNACLDRPVRGDWMNVNA